MIIQHRALNPAWGDASPRDSYGTYGRKINRHRSHRKDGAYEPHQHFNRRNVGCTALPQPRVLNLDSKLVAMMVFGHMDLHTCAACPNMRRAGSARRVAV